MELLETEKQKAHIEIFRSDVKTYRTRVQRVMFIETTLLLTTTRRSYKL